MTQNNDITTLAYDCSLWGMSIALHHQGELFQSPHAACNQQASELVPMIQSLLHTAGIHFRDLKRLITTIGPGSFTGTRIGLATAQGMVSAHKVQVGTLNTAQALACSLPRQMHDTAWVLLDMGKREIAAQKFHVKHTVAEAQDELSLYSPEAFMQQYDGSPCAGNAQALLPGVHHLPEAFHFPDAAAFIYHSCPLDAGESLLPWYIRPADAKPQAQA